MQEISNRTTAFIKAMSNDFNNVKFETTTKEVKLSIGKFSLSRKIGKDYDYAVKKLFEDFLTNTSIYYIKTFWRR